MDSRKKAARIAGWLYLVAALPAPFVLLYIPGKLIVRETRRRLRIVFWPRNHCFEWASRAS